MRLYYKFGLFLILSCIIFNTVIYAKPIKIKVSTKQPQNISASQIPNSWYSFIPRKLPFAPFTNTDYYGIYATPLNVSKYAKADRVYNRNYQPYYPEKFLYVTDYTYDAFMKEKNCKEEFRERSCNSQYNEWLWDKIRSDFKRVHGMYTQTVANSRGKQKDITWEDGGIVSIYEQRKLYYEYARIPSPYGENNYKFLQNFRHNYKNIRVNNPYFEFIQPQDNYFYNDIEVKYECDYDEYTQTYDFAQIAYSRCKDYGASYYHHNSKEPYFMGPDGKLYAVVERKNSDKTKKEKEYVILTKDEYQQLHLAYSYAYHLPDNYQSTVQWANNIQKNIENTYSQELKAKKLNVFLYYELYDTFCRKYGYSYKVNEYEKTIPAGAKLKYNNGSAYDINANRQFYNKYKDYISGQKYPTSEYLDAKRKLEEKNITIEIVPEKKTTKYFRYLSVNSTDGAEKKEVNQQYKTKQGKVKPQPYSVVQTVGKYKKLRKDDIEMILTHLQERLNTQAINISGNNDISTESGNIIMSDNERHEIYIKYYDKPEDFRNYAPELDKKYSKYYPQNL